MAQSCHQFNTIKLYILEVQWDLFIYQLQYSNSLNGCITIALCFKPLLQKIPTFKELHEVCDNFPVTCRCQMKMAEVVTKQPAVRTREWNLLLCGQHNFIRQMYRRNLFTRRLDISYFVLLVTLWVHACTITVILRHNNWPPIHYQIQTGLFIFPNFRSAMYCM